MEFQQPIDSEQDRDEPAEHSEDPGQEASPPALCQIEENEEDKGSKLCSRLQKCEQSIGRSGLPALFQTSHLLFYERFKAYQDYILGDCKPSEVRAFMSDYLEKVLEPCDWLAVWSTEVFDVLVEVLDLELKDLKACVKLVLPLQCDAKGCDITEEAMESLLEATQHKVALQELQVVYEESGDLDETALALEHLRFFYKHIWRQWDEEDEDDDLDYFVRCVEPRLRLYYDILEDRVPAGLVAEYQSLQHSSYHCFQQFSVLRHSLCTDSDSELDNVSMVESLQLYDQLEILKRKLHIIENPLLRYVMAYRGNARPECVQSRGARASGKKVVHVVTASCSPKQLQSLLSAKLMPLCVNEDSEIQFHREPVSAVDSSHQGDVVIVLPGVYSVQTSIFIPDSITIEGFGFPDDVVIEKKNKGDSFVESSGADVKLSNIKFIQHDAIEGILCVREGTLNIENCVLQCESTGVIVRSSARLVMNMCDLYGSKGAGVEIYPSSVCSLVGNGIHHCKDGILIKDFADVLDAAASITLENNVIHNNEGYGVYLVKPALMDNTPGLPAENQQEKRDSEPPVIPTASPPSSGSAALQAESAVRKWNLTRQLSRTREKSCSQSVTDLTDHYTFISMQGNQFRRNGMGDFGTFYY